MSTTVSDAQLAILAEVAGQLGAPGGYTQDEGASQVGFNRRSLQRLLNDGHLTRTDRRLRHLRRPLPTPPNRPRPSPAATRHRRRLVPATRSGRPLLEDGQL